MNSEELLCTRCGRPVRRHRESYYDLFEKMHWLCFHLEFEHEGDPDEPCSDASCHEWQLEVFRRKLAELGHDPEDVLGKAYDDRWPS